MLKYCLTPYTFGPTVFLPMIRRFFLLLVLLAPLNADEVRHPLLKEAVWHPLRLSCSYFNVIRSPAEYELWLTAPGLSEDRVIAMEGGNLQVLKPTRKALSSAIVSENFLNMGERKHPILSRASVTKLPDGRYGALAVVGPRDNGRDSELFPALFVSSDGKRRNWEHLGPPKGEPSAWLKNQKHAGRTVRSEGGSLVLTPDGNLRMYVHGYGNQVCMAEARDIGGPWKFFRDRKGTIIDLANQLPSGGQWLFPHVIRLGKGYLLTGGHQWPTKELWAAVSEDGNKFSYAGGFKSPLVLSGEITGKEPGFKILRAMHDTKTREVILLTNIWTGKGYDIYGTRVPYDKQLWFK